MSRQITIHDVAGTVVVRAGDAVIAETRSALELREEGHEPVWYIPRADLAMELLEPSETVTTCPWKGEAKHFHITAPSGLVRDAAWSYEAPIEGMGAIAGHLAFYEEKAAVERL